MGPSFPSVHNGLVFLAVRVVMLFLYGYMCLWVFHLLRSWRGNFLRLCLFAVDVMLMLKVPLFVIRFVAVVVVAVEM